MIPAGAQIAAERLIQSSEDATSMLSSFRRVMRGNSDGDLLLDSSLFFCELRGICLTIFDLLTKDRPIWGISDNIFYSFF